MIPPALCHKLEASSERLESLGCSVSRGIRPDCLGPRFRSNELSHPYLRHSVLSTKFPGLLLQVSYLLDSCKSRAFFHRHVSVVFPIRSLEIFCCVWIPICVDHRRGAGFFRNKILCMHPIITLVTPSL